METVGDILGANTATVASLTPNSQVTVSTDGLLISTAIASNGQLLIGRTGAAPVLASLTSSTNTLNITNGAGTINLNLSTVGTAGTYSRVVTNAYGQVTSGTTPSGTILQRVTGSVGSGTSTATYAPSATAPATSGGTLMWTANFTPTANTSRVTIEFVCVVDSAIAAATITIAVFRGTTCIGVAIAAMSSATLNARGQTIKHYIVDSPATTSAVAYTARIYSSSATSVSYGQTAAATFGGTAISTYSITEQTP